MVAHSQPQQHALDLFQQNGGMLRMAQALRLGIGRHTLYQMHEQGVVERLARGLYRLRDMPPLSHPDLVTVALRIPRCVVCLVSALSFHELTTQVPHEVMIALGRTAGCPTLHHPPIRVFRFGEPALQAGVETHRLDGVPVRIYTPEKTIADCFKYRNKLGLDLAVHALRQYAQGSRPDVDALLDAARACRVQRVMRPYLEAIL